ncbi:MAG: universal stress protein [Planctomycetota bacterium]
MKNDRVLVATDLSDSATEVLRYGAFVASRFGAPLTAVHALEQLWTSFATLYGVSANDESIRSDLWEEADATLGRRVAEAVPSDMEVTRKVRGGRASDEIVAEAKDGAARLIVIGSHGHTGLSHALLGSVAEQVIRQAPCPVLVLRSGARTAPQIRRILFTTDLSDGSFSALEMAMQFARSFGAEIDVLFVIPEFSHYTPVMQRYLEDSVETGYLETSMARVSERLEEALGARSAADVILNPIVKQGPVVATVLEIASDTPHDMIVATTHGRRGVSHFVLGSVVEKIIRRAPCPVLTLRAVVDG